MISASQSRSRRSSSTSSGPSRALDASNVPLPDDRGRRHPFRWGSMAPALKRQAVHCKVMVYAREKAKEKPSHAMRAAYWDIRERNARYGRGRVDKNGNGELHQRTVTVATASTLAMGVVELEESKL